MAPSSKSAPKINDSQVRVVVRVRPSLPSETQSEQEFVPCVKQISNSLPGEEITVQIKDRLSSRSECYKLDSFFGQEDSLERVFELEVGNLISGVVRGLNATVFAYGATGSGKTYTMQGTDCQPGLIPLSMSRILSTCRENSNNSIEIAFYEVYLDRCYDLLEPKAKEIMVLEDKDGQVHMKGLSKVAVSSMEEFNKIFTSGIQRRKIAHTGLNDVSSRSHAVVSITISNSGVSGKLNLIDLAGNEDNKKTGNEGIRLMESAKINQSLFALSNVIYALNNNEQRIPYRESKLTRILQDSLGGTSLSLMIACLNPTSYHEAIHTVSLAARSRYIGNYINQEPKIETPKVKVDMETKLRAWLESKSKTKVGLFSPVSARTPASLGAKKPASARTASRIMVKDQISAKGRKLFDCPVPALSFNEEVNPRNELLSDLTNLNIQEPSSNEINVEDIETLPCDVPSNSGILNNEVQLKQVEQTPSNSKKLEISFTDKENSGNYVKTVGDLENPTRRVLSPVEYNRPMIIPVEPKTTPKNSFEGGTPLQRFTALSSRLKESLVQEYLEFLNTASREELLELKGIGQKRAEYILELREETPEPLKTLNDLEKIGLSTKQVHNIFKGTARWIFG